MPASVCVRQCRVSSPLCRMSCRAQTRRSPRAWKQQDCRCASILLPAGTAPTCVMPPRCEILHSRLFSPPCAGPILQVQVQASVQQICNPINSYAHRYNFFPAGAVFCDAAAAGAGGDSCRHGALVRPLWHADAIRQVHPEQRVTLQPKRTVSRFRSAPVQRYVWQEHASTGSLHMYEISVDGSGVRCFRHRAGRWLPKLRNLQVHI